MGANDLGEGQQANSQDDSCKISTGLLRRSRQISEFMGGVSHGNVSKWLWWWWDVNRT
jgi:hypothetical protein